mmetsp:Transcript_11864/g.27277  ORF Transcript_11864/g.27277 Transcript_11864/m.27277 type:complete len:412 (-) Transcript_11864:1845-3080(-)
MVTTDTLPNIDMSSIVRPTDLAFARSAVVRATDVASSVLRSSTVKLEDRDASAVTFMSPSSVRAEATPSTSAVKARDPPMLGRASACVPTTHISRSWNVAATMYSVRCFPWPSSRPETRNAVPSNCASSSSPPWPRRTSSTSKRFMPGTNPLCQDSTPSLDILKCRTWAVPRRPSFDTLASAPPTITPALQATSSWGGTPSLASTGTVSASLATSPPWAVTSSTHTIMSPSFFVDAFPTASPCSVHLAVSFSTRSRLSASSALLNLISYEEPLLSAPVSVSSHTAACATSIFPESPRARTRPNSAAVAPMVLSATSSSLSPPIIARIPVSHCSFSSFVLQVKYSTCSFSGLSTGRPQARNDLVLISAMWSYPRTAPPSPEATETSLMCLWPPLSSPSSVAWKNCTKAVPDP